MSRAEQIAWKTYPYEDGTKGLICENSRSIFIQGYQQAEKDLALTWEDVREICKQSVLVEFDLGREISDEKHYGEVLRRFNELKK